MVWDVADVAKPVRLVTLPNDNFQALSVAFSPDQRTLAIGSYLADVGANVSLWDYTELNKLRADPARYACAITGGGLTTEEWARNIPELPYQATCPR